MPEVAPAATESRFHDAPRARLRRVRWWHRLGYIQRRLPEAIAAAFADLRITPHGHILDFGCADRPYRHLLSPGQVYTGADLPGNPDASLHIGADGRVPAVDGSFDAILSTQVLEHVADPHRYMSECARLLRPGGRLLLSTHGIMVYHPDPVDYWRWTGAGLRRQIEQAGLRVLEIRGVMGLAATGLQLFQDGLYARLPRWARRILPALLQPLVALLDRFDTPQARAQNALVLVAMAEKPGSA